MSFDVSSQWVSCELKFLTWLVGMNLQTFNQMNTTDLHWVQGPIISILYSSYICYEFIELLWIGKRLPLQCIKRKLGQVIVGIFKVLARSFLVLQKPLIWWKVPCLISAMQFCPMKNVGSNFACSHTPCASQPYKCEMGAGHCRSIKHESYSTHITLYALLVLTIWHELHWMKVSVLVLFLNLVHVIDKWNKCVLFIPNENDILKWKQNKK